jgi:CHAD domain-containing protein
MSYELRLDKPLGRDLRRLFRQQIDEGLRLARGEKQPNDTLVHDLRKHLKKTRAVLFLVRNRLGTGAFRRQDRRLRNVGRLTREIRDAEVRLQTMQQLQDATRHHYLSYQKIEKLLAAELENFRAAFGDWETNALRCLERARKVSNKWRTGGCKKKHVRRAMQRTYKAGRKALATVREDPSVTKIHELRRQVKLLGYQVSVIRPWNRLVIGEAQKELVDLGHLLGRFHDLTILADRLRLERRERHWGKQDDELLAVIESSEMALRRDGIELAGRFFAERPRKFGWCIDEWFEDRRHVNENQFAESLVNG